jgi:hypothetical protein
MTPRITVSGVGNQSQVHDQQNSPPRIELTRAIRTSFLGQYDLQSSATRRDVTAKPHCTLRWPWLATTRPAWQRSFLARRPLNGRAKPHPILSIELLQLHLFDRVLVVRRGIQRDVRKQHVEMDLIQGLRLPHDVGACKVILALPKHFNQRLRGIVPIDHIEIVAIRNIVLNLKRWIFGLWCWFGRVDH